MHNFTPEDLVQYLYNEASTEKAADIKAALENDWNLREQFEVLSSGRQQLESVNMSPRRKTIENILDYAERAISKVPAQA